MFTSKDARDCGLFAGRQSIPKIASTHSTALSFSEPDIYLKDGSERKIIS